MIKERRSRHIVWKHAFSIIQRRLQLKCPENSIKEKLKRTNAERSRDRKNTKKKHYNKISTTNLQTTRDSFSMHTRTHAHKASERHTHISGAMCSMCVHIKMKRTRIDDKLSRERENAKQKNSHSMPIEASETTIKINGVRNRSFSEYRALC